MRKRTKTILGVLGIIASILLLAWLGGMFAITLQDTTLYSIITSDGNSITLSSPTSSILHHYQAFDASANPSANINDFRNNKVLLPFYLNYLKVNSNDFNVNTNPGSPNCVLIPNYCQSPSTGDKVSPNGLDKNDCPTYTISQRTQAACCSPWGDKVSGSDLSGWSLPQCWPPGANGGVWHDCSSYIVTNSNSGGTRDGIDRSTEINALTSNGWYYDSGNSCFVGGDPNSNNVMISAANSMSCSVSGTITQNNGNSVPYQFAGQITGWEGQYGFGCLLNDSKFALLPSFSGQTNPSLTQGQVRFVIGNSQISESPQQAAPTPQPIAYNQPVTTPSSSNPSSQGLSPQQAANPTQMINQSPPTAMNAPQSYAVQNQNYVIAGFLILLTGGIIFYLVKRKHGKQH